MPFREITEEEKKDWQQKQCFSREHNPPTMMVLKPGLHIWVCPVCKHETVIHTPEMRC